MEDWRSDALCRTAGIDFFEHAQAEAAIAVCRRRPGRAGCRAEAMTVGPVGVVQAGLWLLYNISEAAQAAADLRREAMTYGELASGAG